MSAGDRIPTNLRTLMILEIIGRSDRPMTATEINAELGLPKQTVHRLCTTLERNGYLTRQNGSRHYYPARRLRNMGAGLIHNSRVHIARHQILMDVARQVRETVNFVVAVEDGMSYLDRVETDWAFRVQLPVGSHVPFHCTASGKCFMASLAPRARSRFVASLTLEKLTAATHTDPATLLDDLSLIAERGYSVDEEEFMDGMVAIAVPITDSEGRFLAALAFHGPTPRMSVEGAVRQLDILRASADRLSEAIMLHD